MNFLANPEAGSFVSDWPNAAGIIHNKQRVNPEPIVGMPVPRKEGRDKVTGRAQYIDDMTLPGMLYGATVRSSIPRGKIKSIAFGPGIPWEEFVIVSAKNIPGKNCVALISDDQPCLAEGEVNHCEEPILLLAHEQRHILSKAVGAVTIEYDPLPALFTIEESEKQSLIIWGTDNVFKRFLVEKGNMDAVWSNAEYIVEGEYTTGAQEQLYIENNGVIASYDRKRGITVWGSLQCPYYVHKALMRLLDLPEEKVRVVQTETGGAFGGKEDYPSMIAGHAALLAMKAGKPVKIIYDRMEDMTATTKRHPSRTRHRTAVDRDGKILGGEIDFVIDGGAYATLSSVVLSRGTIHAGGPYHWPSIRIRAKAVATNAPPHGAFRGFGAPQSLFAMERHMDRIAATVGISPVEVRRRNFLKPGQSTTTEQTIREPIDLEHLLDAAWNWRTIERRRNSFGRRMRPPRTRKGSASPRSCMELDLLDRGSVISRLSWAWKVARTAKSACWFRAQNSGKARKPCCAKSRLRPSAFLMKTSRSRRPIPSRCRTAVRQWPRAR